MSPKKAFITGVSGQDGSYLAEFLLEKGYDVHGMIRRASSFNRGRIEHLRRQQRDTEFVLHYGDVADSSNLNRLLERIRPDEIYNLAAQSHVKVSFEVPEYTAEVDGLGTLRMLDAIKETGISTRFYQASTSELFGKAAEVPQKETTPFYPRSPYGAAKLYAYWVTINYREAYGLHAGNGILFNHESPRRGENFVTRKITLGAAAVKAGRQECVRIGNLEARRDWGYAPDYVRAMWMMLQRNTPGDYVIATGESHSVREFVEKAFACLDMKIQWRGEGADEIGVDAVGGKVVVRIDPRYYRPAEVDILQGDASRARNELGWEPGTSFDELVEIMVKADWEKTRT